MNPNEEAALGKKFANQTWPLLPDAMETKGEQAVTTAVAEAHVATAKKDLLILVGSSFFSTLLMLFAPVAAALAKKQAEQQTMKPEKPTSLPN